MVTDDDESLFLEAMRDVKPLKKGMSIPDDEDWVAMLEMAGADVSEGQKKADMSVEKNTFIHQVDYQSVEQIGPLAALSYVAPNLSRKLERKLRKGSLPFREELDLHGLTWKEAEKEVALFLEALSEYSYGCGLLIHGKSHGTVIGRSTMKTMVYHYLVSHPDVFGVISARPKDGGLGAAYVLVD